MRTRKPVASCFSFVDRRETFYGIQQTPLVFGVHKFSHALSKLVNIHVFYGRLTETKTLT